MRVGNHIKHKYDNTGEGPNGAWTIEDINVTGLIWFKSGTYAPYGWIMDEIENGNAIVIKRDLIEKYIKRHKV